MLATALIQYLTQINFTDGENVIVNHGKCLVLVRISNRNTLLTLNFHIMILK